MSKKSTNFELLRILLTLFIPIYHWLLYNGIFYAVDAPNNIVSLALFSGIPFSCMYAFIVMSSYFLIKKKYNWNAKKLFDFLALIVTLLIFKNILIHSLFWGWKMNYYVETFFLEGAWWYVYPYLLVMLFYPFLNYFIYHVSIKNLYGCTALLGILFIINIVTNNTVFINDCIMFLLIYLIMGIMERQKKECHKPGILITVYVIGVSLPAILSVYLKLPSTNIALETANNILQKVHGRYTLAGLVAGIVLFLFFKNLQIPYTPILHKISKITLFVFLLHESVMSVFWNFEIKSCEYLAYLPAAQFWGLLIIYIIFCVLFAALAYKVYYSLIAPLWNKGISYMCENKFVKKLDNTYKKLQEK
ncbi:MAG: hypothetical protein IJ455_06920 [Agathobacter sp.]|nr:hypothetical protein [Agathobacter sp.]